MDKNLQITLTFVIAAAIIICIYQSHVSERNAYLTNVNRPIMVNHNYYSFSYAPSTTNIENVDGKGHAIGDGNMIQNKVA